MDRRVFVTGENVSRDDMNIAFDRVENSIRNQSVDQALVGVHSGLGVGERSGIPDFTIDVAPGVGTDFDGKRLRIPSTQNRSTVTDFSGANTAVGSPGNERWVSIFLAFDVLGDTPKTDADDRTVINENQNEFYKVHIVAGGETTAGNAIRPPVSSHRPRILLADILRYHNQVSILNADIYHDRTDYVFRATAGAVEVEAGTAAEAVQQLATVIDEHVTGATNAHPSTAISFIPGQETFADAHQLVSTNVQDIIDELILALATTAGAARVGAAISAAFADASTIAGGSVRTQIDGIISALAGTTGAAKIGAAAQGSSPDVVTAGSIAAQIGEILTRLAAKTTLSERSRYFAAAAGQGSSTSFTLGDGEVTFSGVCVWTIPLEVEEGDVLTRMIVHGKAASTSLTAVLKRKLLGVAAEVIGQQARAYDASNTYAEIIVDDASTVPLPHIVPATRAPYYLRMTMNSGQALAGVMLEYTRELQS